MALENRDMARRSFIGLVLGLLRIARSTALFILTTYVVAHMLRLVGLSVVHLPSPQMVLDRLRAI
jgi:hypothetical protein